MSERNMEKIKEAVVAMGDKEFIRNDILSYWRLKGEPRIRISSQLNSLVLRGQLTREKKFITERNRNLYVFKKVGK